MATGVYDPDTEGEQSYHPPNLDPLDNKPAGDASDPRTRHAKNKSADGEKNKPGAPEDLRNAESSGDSLFNPEGDEGRKGAVSPAGLAGAESTARTKAGQVGSGFNPNDSASKAAAFRKAVLQNRRKLLIGGGGAAGLAGIALAIFFLLIPLKIEHIVTNLQSRFYSSSENAVGNETQTLLERYMTSKVLPSYKSCGTTVSKNCTPSQFGDGPVENLYRTWSNARLENKLADKYGIEFKYDKASKNWFLKAPGTSPNGDNIGPDGSGINSDFQRADRAGMRTAMGNALEGETRWKNVMVRYQVGRLLDEKYGIKRCLMFCGTKDQLADKKDAKKLAAQLYITQRVITPRTQTLGIVMECLLNPGCNPEQTQSTSVQDGVDGSPVEAENPETDTAARKAAQTLAQSFTGASADELAAEYATASEKGFQKYLLEKVLEKVGLGAISSQAADAVPIVGAVSQAANAISFADRAGPAVQKLGYITNASAAASIFMMYRSYADEIHTGHVDATELGSMTTSLGPGNTGPASDPVKGGTASAEQTPLYQNIVDGSSQTASAINSVLPGKAYADSKSNSSNYTCKDGKPVPSGKLVCNEEVLGQSNSTLDAAHNFLNSPTIQPITTAAHAISGITGAISDALGGILTSIPGVSSVADFVGSILQPFFQDVINLLIPSPFGTNMSGGRKFDMMAAGADVSGNDYAQTGLGGQKLTNQQLADIRNNQQNQEQQSFAHQSLFARMFNTDSQYSLVSKVAMAMPLGTQTTAQSGLASLLNPFSAMSHGFGSMLSNKAMAATPAQPDPFGVVQYGYPKGSIPPDPDVYWQKHCSDNSAQAYQNDADFNSAAGGKGWVGAAAHGSPDPNTGMPVNTTTNPCLLIKAAVGAAGGLMDTSNLTQFDLAEEGQAAGSTTASTTGAATGNAQQLAQQILANNKVTYDCGSSAGQDIKNAAAGKPGTAGAPLNPEILRLIATIGETHQVCVSALESYGQGHSTGSYHYTGDAVDFGNLDGVYITGRNSPAMTIIKIAEGVLPSGTEFGQQSCGPSPPLPAGFSQFDDTCNHLHVQVPRSH